MFDAPSRLEKKLQIVKIERNYDGSSENLILDNWTVVTTVVAFSCIILYFKGGLNDYFII